MPHFDSPQQRERAKQVLTWFNAAATDTENAAVLPLNGKPRDRGESLAIIKKLQARVLARLKAHFESKEAKPPETVIPGAKNTPGPLAEIIKKLKKDNIPLEPTKGDFAEFRKSQEGSEPAPSDAPSDNKRQKISSV